MIRRDFFKTVAAIVVAATLPRAPETWTCDQYSNVWRSSHGNLTTDEELTEAGVYFNGVEIIWDQT